MDKIDVIPRGTIASLSSVTECELVGKLGEGSFGQVWHCKHDTEECKALKLMKGCSEQAVAAEVERHLRSFHAVGAEHAPYLYQSLAVLEVTRTMAPPASQQVGMHMIMMQYIDGGNATSVSDRYGMPEMVAKLVMFETLQALKRLHAANIIHCDVKGDNILVDRSGKCYLADFGCSKVLQKEDDLPRSMSICGTPYFMAPELCTFDGFYDHTVDLWAAGITAHQLATGCCPLELEGIEALESGSPEHIFGMICHGPLPRMPQVPGYSMEYGDLFERLVRRESERRVPAAELIRDRYFEERLFGDPWGEARQRLRECFRNCTAY